MLARHPIETLLCELVVLKIAEVYITHRDTLQLSYLRIVHVALWRVCFFPVCSQPNEHSALLAINVIGDRY